MIALTVIGLCALGVLVLVYRQFERSFYGGTDQCPEDSAADDLYENKDISDETRADPKKPTE